MSRIKHNLTEQEQKELLGRMHLTIEEIRRYRQPEVMRRLMDCHPNWDEVSMMQAEEKKGIEADRARVDPDFKPAPKPDPEP